MLIVVSETLDNLPEFIIGEPTHNTHHTVEPILRLGEIGGSNERS